MASTKKPREGKPKVNLHRLPKYLDGVYDTLDDLEQALAKARKKLGTGKKPPKPPKPPTPGRSHYGPDCPLEGW